MDRVASFESRRRQAARVAGLARTFETVDQDQFADRLAVRILRMHQDFDSRLALIADRLHGPAVLAFRAGPKVAGDGRKVAVLEKWFEGEQLLLLQLDYLLI